MEETIAKSKLRERLLDLIKGTIWGEGGLVEYAREIRHKDPRIPLPEEDQTAIGEILWCETGEAEMAHASKLCGTICGFFELARSLELDLGPEAGTLSDWEDTINPSE